MLRKAAVNTASEVRESTNGNPTFYVRSGVKCRISSRGFLAYWFESVLGKWLKQSNRKRVGSRYFILLTYRACTFRVSQPNRRGHKDPHTGGSSDFKGRYISLENWSLIYQVWNLKLTVWKSLRWQA